MWIFAVAEVADLLETGLPDRGMTPPAVRGARTKQSESSTDTSASVAAII